MDIHGSVPCRPRTAPMVHLQHSPGPLARSLGTLAPPARGCDIAPRHIDQTTFSHSTYGNSDRHAAGLADGKVQPSERGQGGEAPSHSALPHPASHVTLKASRDAQPAVSEYFKYLRRLPMGSSSSRKATSVMDYAREATSSGLIINPPAMCCQLMKPP